MHGSGALMERDRAVVGDPVLLSSVRMHRFQKRPDAKMILNCSKKRAPTVLETTDMLHPIELPRVVNLFSFLLHR